MTPFLINEPATYCTFQGEYGNVYSNHRLRSRITLDTYNMWMTARYGKKVAPGPTRVSPAGATA